MSEVKGKIIIIKRNGQDRVTYPLMSNSCLFGSGLDCDIRVQLPSVSERHCVLKVGPKDKVYLTSLSHGNITLLNNIPVSGTVPVNHKDILTVVDRCFRFEYPPKSSHYIEDDSCASVPEVKSLKVLSPKEKPPLFQVNGTPGKTPASLKKKMMRKSLGTADIHFITDSELSPLSRPRKSYNKKNSPSPRSIMLSARRKRVSFGPALSPEQFDKNMPPATPVRRGSLPRRHATTPDYFGSPIITQYPRSKKKRPSVNPREQSIAEEILETSEAENQSPKNKSDAVSPKSVSPSTISKSGSRTKGSPIQMLQQEESKKTPDVTRKSPLARKSPKSASKSPVSKSISPMRSPAGKSKTNLSDTVAEVAVQPSSYLPDSPKQTDINAQKSKSTPSKLQHNSPKEKGSPSKLSPMKGWASVVSPSSKHASPLSRRKSSIHSSMNLSSAAVTPSLSPKIQGTEKRISSSGKRSSPSHAVKRLSAGKSPARPVSLSTPTRKSPLKIQKRTSSASKVHYSHSTPSESSEKKSSFTEKLLVEVPLSEDQNTTYEFSAVFDLVENSSSHVTTPKSSKHRQDHEKLSTGKKSHILKRLSVAKSPAQSPSLRTPPDRTSGKFSSKNRSSSKQRLSFHFTSNSSRKEVSKNEASFSENHSGELGENNTGSIQSPFSHQIDDSAVTPVGGRKSKSFATPKSSSKRQSLVTNTPESKRKNEVSETPDAKQDTPVSTSRISRSPVASESAKKKVSSPLKKTPPVTSPKTPGSKRKASFPLSPEPPKKKRLSASPSLKLTTSPSKVSPKSQVSLLESRSTVSPKAVLSNPTSATPERKKAHSTPSKASPDRTPFKTKLTPVARKSKTPAKISPGIKSPLSPLKENAKTPQRSKVTPLSVKTKVKTPKVSPLAKSPSSAAKLKLKTPAKKVTPVTKKSSAKKVTITRSSKKPGTSSSSTVVQSAAKSVKVFSIKKSNKKPLWTEIVRRGIMKKKVTSKPKVVRSLLSNAVKTKKAFKLSDRKLFHQKAVPVFNKKIASVMSTGHAESPETIVIRKRSTLPKPGGIKKLHTKDLQSPLDSGVMTDTSNTSSKISPMHSSVKSRKTSSAAKRKSLFGHQKVSSDISPVSTPNISQERFVSPLTTPRVTRKNNSFIEKYVQENQHVIKTAPVKSFRKSETPKADYSNVTGIKRLVKTPKVSPKADYRDVRGVKKLVQTPKDSPKADYSNVGGIQRLVQTPKETPKADYRDVRGIRRLVQTPKDSPKADYRNVSGVKNLLRTPAAAKHIASQAETVSIKQLFQNHTPPADYTKVKGVKQLFKATRPIKGKVKRASKTKNSEVVREPDFTNVEGVKQLFREPEENEFNISGLQQLFSPVPTVSFGAKPDVVSPTVQEESPLIQKVSSPKSRRKQSFGSLSPATNLIDNDKKMVHTSSPVPQENMLTVEHTSKKDVMVSPPKLREGSGRRAAIETPGSAGKAFRSSRGVTVTPSQHQTPNSLYSPLGRKSARTVVPLDTPLTSRSPKASKPEKSVTSPLQSATVPSPSMTSPKTRQQTPRSASHDRKDPESQKRRGKVAEEEEKKSDVEANKTEPSSFGQNMPLLSTPQRAKRGGKNSNANKTPEIIFISDEDNVAVSEQKLKRGGKSKSAATTGKRKAVAGKKSKKGVVKQDISDSVEAQQAVSEASPRKSIKAEQSQTAHAIEIAAANEAVPNDLSAGRRATRSKASDVKTLGAGRNATGLFVPKGGRSTRSKKNSTAADEVLEHSEVQTSDSSDLGGRASRRKAVASSEPVALSSPALISSPKVEKKSKANKLEPEDVHLSGTEPNEIDEVKGARRTRGRGQAVGTPVKKTVSKSVVPAADEHRARKGTRRGALGQATATQNLPSDADLSESLVENVSVDKALSHSENVSTAPSKTRKSRKQKQGTSVSDAGTPSSAKSPKTRRNRKFSSSGDNEKTPSKTAPEIVATPKKSTRSKKVAVELGDANSPRILKEPRSRRNQKALQGNKTASDMYEGGATATESKRTKRGRQQESENFPEVLPKRTKTEDWKQASVSSTESSSASIDSTDESDAVRYSKRGKTAKIDTSDVRIEVLNTKRTKRQSKRSVASQKNANETSVSEEQNAVVSQSSQKVAVKREHVHSVNGVLSESERPKRASRAKQGASSTSGDVNDTGVVNSKRLRAKRSAVDSKNDAVSPKRTRKGTIAEEGASAVEGATKPAKVQPKSSKTHTPVLEAIPEVEEEVSVTPSVKRATRAKASSKQAKKESPVRRPTRSRRK